MRSSDQANLNHNILRDCVADPLIQRCPTYAKSDGKRRSKACKKSEPKHPGSDESMAKGDAEELADFIDFIASELFASLPAESQEITFAGTKNDGTLAAKYSNPLPPATLKSLLALIPLSVVDSLEAYSFTSQDEISNLFTPIFEAYITAATTPPPPNDPTARPTACEICHRDWVPLTYHHLIPRQVHAKVIKRGWHEEWRLSSVAWLCRACHSFVHKIASNEELAREWWSVEQLLEREDVQGWAAWVGRVRWKAR